jgi:hypothetical protein
MTDVQLYFAIGLPTFAALLCALVHWFYMRGVRTEIRNDFRAMRDELRSVRTAIELPGGEPTARRG